MRTAAPQGSRRSGVRPVNMSEKSKQVFFDASGRRSPVVYGLVGLLVAFIGALCFAWMAVATTRRIRNGPTDSIWSIRKADGDTVPHKPAATPAE